MKVMGARPAVIAPIDAAFDGPGDRVAALFDAHEEAWLVRVLINIRRDEWRRAAVRKRSAAALRAGVANASPTQESALIAKHAVWRALDVLQPRRRAIVIMHELEGLSLPAIASLLGVSVMTVRWHLSMGRRDLKRLLTPQFGEIT